MPIVVGTDGHVPVYDPEARWTTFAKDEIYLGGDAQGKFVPKVSDYVREPSTFETWIVDHLDPLTLIPTLRSIHPSGMNYDLSEEDVLFGVGPGAHLDTYKAFLNDSVLPYTLSIDPRFMPKGTMSSYAKVFKGVNTSSTTGKVLSKVYDAGGNFVSQSVPLEIVALDSHTNYACKIVQRCHITEKLRNGEVVTVVIYADDGHVVERRQLLVENTDTFSDVTASTKYISEINLESIWLSATSPDVLEYPLNIPMDALNLVGVVHYSDGTSARYPVDGTKFSMFGLDGRLASTVEPDADLVLSYQMSSSELAYASTGVNGRMITKPYRLRTVNTNESIAVKLYAFPVWVSDVFGYRLKFFLSNLARNVWFDVTNEITFNTNTGPYDPKLYGYLQRKSVSLNLRDVSPSFIPFIHTQSIDVVLQNAATSDPSGDWMVRTTSSDSNPGFGSEVYGRKIGNLANLSSGCQSLTEWLNKHYWPTLPQFDASKEVAAPTPTHFEVTYGSTVTTWEISQWNADLAVAATVTSKSTVTIRFIKRTAGGDLTLSFAAMMIKSFT